MALGKIKADTLEHSTAGSLDTSYVVDGSAKAYIDFNGSGTVAIRGSLNTASITDHGSGDYTQAFSNSFSNNNYSSWMNCTQEAMASNNVSIGINEGTRPTTLALRCLIQRDSGTDVDEQDVNYGSVGDLA